MAGSESVTDSGGWFSVELLYLLCSELVAGSSAGMSGWGDVFSGGPGGLSPWSQHLHVRKRPERGHSQPVDQIAVMHELA